MRRLWSILVTAGLLAGLCLPVWAAESASKSWKVGASAHVLSVRADELVVLLKTPSNLKINKNDYVSPVQCLPLEKDTAFVDERGGALAGAEILPGQAVKVFFRYTYRDSDLFRYDRELVPMTCFEVALREDVIEKVSTAKPGALKPDEAIGTIVKVSGNNVEIYVEDGYTVGRTETKRFYGVGLYNGEVDGKTKYKGPKGSTLKLSDLKPFQRVKVTGSAEFFDGSLGFNWYDWTSIEVLGAGEKVLDPAALNYDNVVSCTVLENRGGKELLVRPAPGSWLAGQGGTFLVPYSAGTPPQPEPPFAFRQGERVQVRFEGIDTSADPGVLEIDTGGVWSLK